MARKVNIRSKGQADSGRRADRAGAGSPPRSTLPQVKRGGIGAGLFLLINIISIPFQWILFPFIFLFDVLGSGTARFASLLGHALARLMPPIYRGAKWLCRPVVRFCHRMPWYWALAILALIGLHENLYLATYGREWLLERAELTSEHLTALNAGGFHTFLSALETWAAWGSGICVLAFLMSFVPRRWARPVQLLAALQSVALSLGVLYLLVEAPSYLFLQNFQDFYIGRRNELWVTGVWSWIPVFLVMAFWLVTLFRTGAKAYQKVTVDPTDQPMGERIFQNVASHGTDRRFRKSLYVASFGHIFVIFIVPLILARGCMEEPYGIPKGSGNPVAARVKRVPPKKKPKAQIALNMNSAFIFKIPKLNDSQVLQELQDATENEYVADRASVGQVGEGGGSEGGWPDGMEGAKLRFIRLEYRGGDWDQDMGKGADYNILQAIHKRHGFKIWPNTESRPVPQLRKFPAHRAPPFVYLTGGLKGTIHMSSDEIKTLRWYCLEEGGMIFADNGGPLFNAGFRRLMKRIFPKQSLLDIPSDDPIFQQPYLFPNGAPALWHHSGMRAMGVKHRGRWVVFYHQGDINDAWKEGGSGASERVRQDAFKLGINVIAYSFRHYLALHRISQKK